MKTLKEKSEEFLERHLKIREDSLYWWNNLDKRTQRRLFQEYLSNYFTPAKSDNDLTGREIQIIYQGKKH